MADSFDGVDIMQEILGETISGIPVYKERVPLDLSAADHVVIRSTGNSNLEVVNVATVNVNIYMSRLYDGTANRSGIKTARSAVRSAVESADDPDGYYCIIDEVFSAILEDAKEGFDCFSIRYELTLNN